MITEAAIMYVQPGAVKLGPLASLDAPELHASSDVREPISLHQAVYVSESFHVKVNCRVQQLPWADLTLRKALQRLCSLSLSLSLSVFLSLSGSVT